MTVKGACYTGLIQRKLVDLPVVFCGKPGCYGTWRWFGLFFFATKTFNIHKSLEFYNQNKEKIFSHCSVFGGGLCGVFLEEVGV